MHLVSEKDYIAHHGIKGQKWGIRRYRNEDGTLTEAGKKHYSKAILNAEAKQRRANQSTYGASKNYQSTHKNVLELQTDIMDQQLRNTKEYKAYSKALGDLESYEEDFLNTNKTSYNVERMLNDKKWAALKDALADADEKYSSRIGEVYYNNADRIVSAKLKDLGFSDDPNLIELYKDVLANRFPSLTEETRLRLIH